VIVSYTQRREQAVFYSHDKIWLLFLPPAYILDRWLNTTVLVVSQN